jgi:hypothetical protein
MGLTLHYSLSLPRKTPIGTVKSRLGALRQCCLDLPFASVGDMLEFAGEYCNFERPNLENSIRWLLIQSGKHCFYEIDHRGNARLLEEPANGCYGIKAIPERIIAFHVQPGGGCEPANIGLRLLPKTIEVQKPDGAKTELKMRSRHWGWSSFSKTQYAADPREGGIHNFLRCHLSLVAMLDRAQELGFGLEVHDEGGFYQSRDVADLCKEVSNQSEVLAAFAGALKDVSGGKIEAPILGNPQFERLEMKGSSRVDPALAKVIQQVVKVAASRKDRTD